MSVCVNVYVWMCMSVCVYVWMVLQKQVGRLKDIVVWLDTHFGSKVPIGKKNKTRGKQSDILKDAEEGDEGGLMKRSTRKSKRLSVKGEFVVILSKKNSKRKGRNNLKADFNSAVSECQFSNSSNLPSSDPYDYVSPFFSETETETETETRSTFDSEPVGQVSALLEPTIDSQTDKSYNHGCTDGEFEDPNINSSQCHSNLQSESLLKLSQEHVTIKQSKHCEVFNDGTDIPLDSHHQVSEIPSLDSRPNHVMIDVDNLLHNLCLELPLSKAAKVAAKITGRPRKQLYARGVILKNPALSAE